MTEKASPPPAGPAIQRPPDIVLPVGQPIPPGPGLAFGKSWAANSRPDASVVRGGYSAPTPLACAARFGTNLMLPVRWLAHDDFDKVPGLQRRPINDRP